MEKCKECKWYDKIVIEGEKRASWKYEEVCCNPKASYIIIPKEKVCQKWEAK